MRGEGWGEGLGGGGRGREGEAGGGLGRSSIRHRYTTSLYTRATTARSIRTPITETESQVDGVNTAPPCPQMKESRSSVPLTLQDRQDAACSF